MGLKHSYTILSPIYDLIVSAPTKKLRRQSLHRLNQHDTQQVLINGIGSGFDIPHLPKGPQYTATDLTPAMLSRAHKRAQASDVNIELKQADSMDLPFANDTFDIVVMHLILAVVTDPISALQEAQRVTKTGGKIFIIDKFLRPRQLAPLRRLLSPMLRHVATNTNVVFEDLHKQCPQLKLIDDQPALLAGWFRSIELEKQAH